MTKRTSKAMGARTGDRVVYGYCRVSTTEQATEGVSLEAQRHAIESYAAANGLRLAGIEVDAGISGGRMANRPALQRAVAAVCETGGVLVAYSLSRLARNAQETLALADKLESAGADLASLSEKIDTSGACGKMTFRLLAVLAEFEKDLVSERTSMGLAEKRRRGEKTGGSTPFGYTVEDRDGTKMLVAVPEEQAAIAEAVALRNAGLSLRRIGAALEAKGVRPKAGGTWHAKVLRSILARAA